ncbi:MAG: hypothetical protein LBV46_04645 [Bacteroidales bacterium]|jgi:hypothetical protein|nr:hypothetical protein [Bacteroidales bacterium]
MNKHGISPKTDTRIASKETVRKNIRDASNESRSFQNESITSPLKGSIAALLPSTYDMLNSFRAHFQKAGGILVDCTRNNFLSILAQHIAKTNAGMVLNTSDYLKPLLEKQQIPFSVQKPYNQNPDLAIAYSPGLIAHTGGMLFSSALNTYSSVKNLASNLVVISFTQFLVPTVSDALNLLKLNSDVVNNPCNNSEIILPTPLVDQKPTCKNPQIFLYLISPEVNQSL